MISSITVKEITFWNESLIYAIRNVSFTFDLKKLSENALRFVTDSWIFCHAQRCSADFTRVDRPTILEV